MNQGHQLKLGHRHLVRSPETGPPGPVPKGGEAKGRQAPQ